MSTPWSWSGGGRRQADKVRWSQKVTEMGRGTDKDEKGKKGGCTMTAFLTRNLQILFFQLCCTLFVALLYLKALMLEYFHLEVAFSVMNQSPFKSCEFGVSSVHKM